MKCLICGFIEPGEGKICPRCGSPAGSSRELQDKNQANEHTPIPGNLTGSAPIKEDSLAFSPGDPFGERYIILEEIDRGGMGRIFKALDKVLNIIVALKMIHPELLVKPNTIRRFKKEILLARQIAHENIIRIYDFGETENINFITMEYIEGKNLANFLKQTGKPDLETSLDIAKQICRGLQAAHKKGIIHRDLKPQNIMIDKKGKVYITDFGLARTMEDQRITITGVLVGTPQYISPEQAKGENADTRSDIYSLGIVLYELSTGRELFKSDTLVGFLQKHLLEKPTPPSGFDPDFPPFLESIILKCLRKNADKRYQDAGEILEDLEKKKSRTSAILLNPIRKKTGRYIVSIFLAAAVALAAYTVTSRIIDSSTGHKAKNRRISLAVLHPEILMSEKNPGQISRTIQGLLITDLSQSPYFQVLSDHKLFDILEELGQLENNRYTPDILRQIASQGKVEYLILGKYIQSGGNSRYDLEILNMDTGSSSYTPVWSKEGDDIFTFVDLITKEIKQNFFAGEKLPGDIDMAVNEITTASIEAFNYYLEGERYFWDRNFSQSNESLEKAISLDPRFAMAYKQLSINYIYLGRSQAAAQYLREAIQLINRISVKERYYILIYENWHMKGMPKAAVEICREFLNKYPGEVENKILLGSIYRSMEDWEKEEQVFNDILETDKNSWPAHMNLSYIYFSRGEFNRSLDILLSGNHRALFGQLPDFHRYLAYIYLAQENYPQALAEIQQFQRLLSGAAANRGLELMGLYYHIVGNLDEAESNFRQLTGMADKNTRAAGFSRLFQLYLLEGRYTACSETLDQAIRLCREDGLKESEVQFLLFYVYLEMRLGNSHAAVEKLTDALDIMQQYNSPDFLHFKEIALNFQGQIYVILGYTAKAKETAAQLKQLIHQTGSEKQYRLFYHLNGMIALAGKNPSVAVENFEKAYRLVPFWKNSGDVQVLYLDNMAEAYKVIGKPDKVEECYKKIQTTGLGKIMWGDIYTHSFYRLGQLYREQGRQQEAMNQLTEFIRLLQAADNGNPGLRQVLRDAQKQLVHLQGQ